MTQKELSDMINESVNRQNAQADRDDFGRTRRTDFNKEMFKQIKHSENIQNQEGVLDYLVGLYMKTYER